MACDETPIIFKPGLFSHILSIYYSSGISAHALPTVSSNKLAGRIGLTYTAGVAAVYIFALPPG